MTRDEKIGTRGFAKNQTGPLSLCLRKSRLSKFSMTKTIFLLFGLAFATGPVASAAIIGTNSPALPLTLDRIATLPAAEQPAWKEYLKHSVQQMSADKKFFFAEMKKHRIQESSPAPKGGSENQIPMRHPAAWYGQPEALRIADVILSFQTPAGGWTKGVNMTANRRAPGQQFFGDNSIVNLSKSDNDLPNDAAWHYVGTFDNGATTTQLRFLAKVVNASEGDRATPYRTGFFRGLDYMFASQFPNGGWPQVWPLQGGYSDAITYNDNAMLNVMQLLRDVAKGTGEFAFVPKAKRERAADAIRRGIECILKTQIVVNGRRTVWCQQHDALTLQPTPARNYEMPSQCGSESSKIAEFLMQEPNPGRRIIATVHAAAIWLEKTQLHDVAEKRDGAEGKRLVAAPGAGPIWARYYQIGSDRPIFGDRDRTIHDDMNEISKERRNGYGWFNISPQQALNLYALWAKKHPPGSAEE